MLKQAIAALGMLSILAACQNEESSVAPNPRKDINLTRAEQDMTNVGTDFAFRFFNQVCKTETEKPNLFVSPLSASLCLSMMTNGAGENTLAEMKTALGFPDLSLDAINAYNQKIVSALLDLDNTTRLGIANSIWIKQGFSVKNAFIDVNRTMYDAQVKELDFTSPQASDVINQWCAEKTNNCIKKVLTEIPENARLYLLNALYFKGIWTNQFDKSNTKQEAFTNAYGGKPAVPMMNLYEESIAYAQNDYFAMAELPYGNEAFSMVVLLPAEGKTLEECLPELTDKHWAEWKNQLTRRLLNVKLPRFRMNYEKDLIKDMKALGMIDAFDTDKADLSGISADEDLYVSLLKQVTYIDVNEEGTEAAAVTIGGDMVSSPGPAAVIPFYVNRPFAFLIQEKSTGVILFMGKVTEL